MCIIWSVVVINWNWRSTIQVWSATVYYNYLSLSLEVKFATVLKVLLGEVHPIICCLRHMWRWDSAVDALTGLFDTNYTLYSFCVCVFLVCICLSVALVSGHCLYLSICCPGEWPLSVSVYLLPWWVATVCICLSVALVSGHYLYLSIYCPGEWHKRTSTLDWTSSCNALLSTRMSSTDQILHFQQVCVTGGGCMQHCRCIIAKIGNVRLVSVRLHAMT